MKLINHTLLVISAILFVTVGLWSVLFYYQMLNQFKTTIDEGLANYKIVIIDKLKDDSLLIEQDAFLDNNYILKRVSEDYALKVRDSYKDTLITSSTKQISYQTRLLTTAFVASDGEYYEMMVISQELDKGKLYEKLALSLLCLVLFMFLSTILVNNFVLKNTWKPFYHLLQYIKNFRLDKELIQELPETKIKEFMLLNDSVIDLQKTNKSIFNNQKQFIENVSHEMQTPLAIGINKLELLAGEKDLSPEQIQKIGSIIEAFQHLSGLNKSLLLLSKIENKQFISEDRVNFYEIINRLIDGFSDFTEYQKIQIRFLKEESWMLEMNKDIAEILVMNLFKNAIIHNCQGGELFIRMSKSSFTIENTSNDLAIPANKLFERFNKKPNSKQSTGLGLAIVKAIVDVSGLDITYSFNERHVFKVSKKT